MDVKRRGGEGKERRRGRRRISAARTDAAQEHEEVEQPISSYCFNLAQLLSHHQEPLGVHDFIRAVHTVKYLQRHPDTLGTIASAAGGGARAFFVCWIWSMELNEPEPLSLSLQPLSGPQRLHARTTKRNLHASTKKLKRELLHRTRRKRCSRPFDYVSTGNRVSLWHDVAGGRERGAWDGKCWDVRIGRKGQLECFGYLSAYEAILSGDGIVRIPRKICKFIDPSIGISYVYILPSFTSNHSMLNGQRSDSIQTFHSL